MAGLALILGALASPAWAQSPSALPALRRPMPEHGGVTHVTAALPALRTPAAVPEGQLPAEIALQVAELKAALHREVPHLASDSAAREAEWIALAQAEFDASDEILDHPQLIVVVDRNPRVQQMRIMLAGPGIPWQVIGGTRVSTGQKGRFDYYITPRGVFLHTDAILDYRAEGTYNENHIRGLGVKGMRVWDFGWQSAAKGWRGDRERGDIRLLIHATDPAVLEQRIGHTASKGCIRVPAAMNRFLDRHGVLDADYERAAVDDIRYRALLLANRTPTPLAGDALVVIDSSERMD